MNESQQKDRIVEIRAGAENLRRLGLVDRAELQDRLADELQRRLDQPAVGLTEPGAWTVTESRRRQLAEELGILRQLEDAARLAPHAVLEELAVLDDESASPVAEKRRAAASGPAKDSGHYNYPLEIRKAIVQEFRQARAAGEIENIEAWAQARYQISGKTLKNYRKEFPAET